MREKWLLAGVLLAATPSADAAQSNENDTLRDKNGEPVQAGVFTSRWGSLFSGNDKKFSGALSFSSGLKEQWMSIPNSSDSATQKRKINQTLNLSLQYSPYSFWFANITSRLPVRDTSRYTADFRYSFGYDDWHANTVSLVYSNYGDFPSGFLLRRCFRSRRRRGDDVPRGCAPVFTWPGGGPVLVYRSGRGSVSR